MVITGILIFIIVMMFFAMVVEAAPLPTLFDSTGTQIQEYDYLTFPEFPEVQVVYVTHPFIPEGWYLQETADRSVFYPFSNDYAA